MNPRITNVPLHADQPRESGLPVDYYHEPDFGKRWFHFLLGVCIGAGFCAVLMFAVFVQ